MHVNQVPRGMSASGDFLCGHKLGRCLIEGELGRGGMGVVYRGRHLTLDIPVAVKVLSPQLAATNPACAERFQREARLAARIRHPNLVGVMDVDQDPATHVHYLVMEYVDGVSVRRLLDGGPLHPDRAIAIARDVASALVGALEHQVIHRDIKPENILVATDGTVKLADLGLAKQMGEDHHLTASSATLGTPLYMSPEQINRAARTDHISDIYSLGVTLYVMLTGRVPYDGDSFYSIANQILQHPVPDPQKLRPEIGTRLSSLIRWMMAKDPGARPQHPTVVIQHLEECIGETPGGQPLVSTRTLASGLRSLPPLSATVGTLDAVTVYPSPVPEPVGSTPSFPPCAELPPETRSMPWSSLLSVAVLLGLAVAWMHRAPAMAPPGHERGMMGSPAWTGDSPATASGLVTEVTGSRQRDPGPRDEPSPDPGRQRAIRPAARAPGGGIIAACSAVAGPGSRSATRGQAREEAHASATASGRYGRGLPVGSRRPPPGQGGYPPLGRGNGGQGGHPPPGGPGGYAAEPPPPPHEGRPRLHPGGPGGPPPR